MFAYALVCVISLLHACAACDSSHVPVYCPQQGLACANIISTCNTNCTASFCSLVCAGQFGEMPLSCVQGVDGPLSVCLFSLRSLSMLRVVTTLRLFEPNGACVCAIFVWTMSVCVVNKEGTCVWCCPLITLLHSICVWVSDCLCLCLCAYLYLYLNVCVCVYVLCTTELQVCAYLFIYYINVCVTVSEGSEPQWESYQMCFFLVRVSSLCFKFA